jgi:TATA-binding protein-associated factor Taf7
LAPKSSENFKHALRTDENIRIAKFFDGDIFPFNIELDVYGDKVAIITLNEDKVCGVVIEIPSVAESMRSICELLRTLL